MKDKYCEHCGIKIDDINYNKNKGKYSEFICCDNCFNLYENLRDIINNNFTEEVMKLNKTFFNYKVYKQNFIKKYCKCSSFIENKEKGDYIAWCIENREPCDNIEECEKKKLFNKLFEIQEILNK